MTKKRKVLLLDSFCSGNSHCTKDMPCEDCLQKCDVYEIPEGVLNIEHNFGAYKYLRDIDYFSKV